MELVSFGERNVVFLTGSENHNVSNILHISNTSNDLEKAHLIIEAQQTEITYLKEIIELMKAKQAN
jgi:hypothetical protein